MPGRRVPGCVRPVGYVLGARLPCNERGAPVPRAFRPDYVTGVCPGLNGPGLLRWSPVSCPVTVLAQRGPLRVPRVLARRATEHLDVIEHLLPCLDAALAGAAPDLFAPAQVQDASGESVVMTSVAAAYDMLRIEGARNSPARAGEKPRANVALSGRVVRWHACVTGPATRQRSGSGRGSPLQRRFLRLREACHRR